MDNHIYEVSLTWKEGRIGEMESPVLQSKIEVATPPEFENGVHGIWSPEHLYIASVLSCFMTTFLAIAQYSKLEFNSFDCNAKGVLDKVDGKFQMTEIILNPTLVISDETKVDRALRILEKSEKACLISNSIKTEVKLDPTVEVEVSV